MTTLYDDRRRLVEELSVVGKLAGAGLLMSGRFEVFYDPASAIVGRVGGIFRNQPRHQTLQSAIDACRNGAGDAVLLVPKDDGSAFALTSDITINRKNFVKLIGASQGRLCPALSFANQTRIVIGDATATLTTGVEVTNIRSTGTSTSANTRALYIDSSSRKALVRNSLFEVAGANVGQCAWDRGRNTHFDHCQFGATAASAAGRGYQSEASLGLEPIFDNCEFLLAASAVGNAFVELGLNTGLAIFRDCMCFNPSVGTTAMTAGVILTATGAIPWLIRSPMVGATVAGPSTGFSTPSGMGLNVALADVFNPNLAIPANEPVAVDT